jgi:hypothetical protein
MKLRTHKDMNLRSLTRLLEKLPETRTLSDRTCRGYTYSAAVETLTKGLPRLNADQLSALEAVVYNCLRATKKDD